MNIKIITVKYNAEGGGANHSLRLLVEKLRSNHNIEILTVKSELNHYKKSSVPIREVSANSKIDAIYNSVQSMKLFEDETDIYHIFSPPLIPAGGIYRKLNGSVPVIGRLNSYNMFCTNFSKMDGECHKNCTLLNKINHDDKDTIKKPTEMHKYIYRHSSLKLASYIDQAIAISPAIKKIHHSAGLSVPTDVIPNFYDSSFSTNSSPTNLLKKKILYVGRLEHSKGVSTLIDAFAKLDRDDVSLEIIGDGPERDKLEMAVKKKSIENNVSFGGWVKYNELSNLYSNSTVFVHPGVWPEPFGRTILEAMQHQLPLIVSDTGAPPWIAQDAALTFEPRDSSMLADVLSVVIDDQKKQAKMADASESRVKDFSPDIVISQIDKLYRQVAKKDYKLSIT